MKNKILVLCGKSGAGKDTIAEILKDKVNLNFITSHSTRPIRENESQGNPYYFIDKHQMLEFIDQDKLIEYRTYNTILNGEKDIWYYAVHKDEVKDDKSYVVVLDIEGLKDFKRYFSDRVISVYIDVDNYTRTKRAKERGSFCEEEWDRRLKADTKDFKNAYLECNYVVDNKNLEQCIEDIEFAIKD